jgi:hypothetical protein
MRFIRRRLRSDSPAASSASWEQTAFQAGDEGLNGAGREM